MTICLLPSRTCPTKSQLCRPKNKPYKPSRQPNNRPLNRQRLLKPTKQLKRMKMGSPVLRQKKPPLQLKLNQHISQHNNNSRLQHRKRSNPVGVALVVSKLDSSSEAEVHLKNQLLNNNPHKQLPLLLQPLQ